MSSSQERFSHDWFDQWNEVDSYVDSDGNVNRIPLRLTSSNLVVYGGADYDEAMKEFDHEHYQPVSVGGKVPVQVWFNDFHDTDCGPFDRVNAYTETWFSFFVTPKDKRLELPFESPFSYNVDHPDALNWTHRVLCGGDADGDTTGGQAAITGGREVWGFPKHPGIADLSFTYPDDKTVAFTGALHGNKAVAVRAVLPESVEGCVTVPVDAKAAPGSCITPKQNPLKAGFIPKQVRYTTALAATMHFSPWDPDTDKFELFDEEEHYGALLKSWNFQPALKMNTRDLKIVALKPTGWASAK